MKKLNLTIREENSVQSRVTFTQEAHVFLLTTDAHGLTQTKNTSCATCTTSKSSPCGAMFIYRMSIVVSFRMTTTDDTIN